MLVLQVLSYSRREQAQLACIDSKGNWQGNRCHFFSKKINGNWHLNQISLSQRLWDEMTLMIVRWRRVRTWLIRFLPFLSTLSMKAMKEFVHRMRLHYFLKTTVRDILGRGDCTKGDPFYRSFDWVCPQSLRRSHTLRKLTQLIF